MTLAPGLSKVSQWLSPYLGQNVSSRLELGTYLPPGQLGSDNTGVNQAVDLVAWMVKNLPAVQETWV